VTILDVLLNDYLSKEDVQQLARDRGLPAGRTKGDLIDLLHSRHLDPAEALAFLNVTALRDLCREFGLDRSGDRDALFNRLLAAVRAESAWGLERQLPSPVLSSAGDGEPARDGKVLDTESAGPWTVVGVIVTAVVAGVLVLGTSKLGTFWGIVLSVVVAVVLAIVLLRTSHRWHPRIASLRHGPGS
jgi:hypothetical protein